jgi:hypothetical protein
MSTIPAPRTTAATPVRIPASERQLGDVARALAGVGLSWNPAGRRPAALYWAMAEELAAHGLLAPIPAEPAEAADPDRPHVVDAVGRRVYPGDTVGGTTSDRYQTTITGPVVQIGRGKVKIRVEQGGGSPRPKAGDEKWISTDRVFLVASAQTAPARAAQSAVDGPAPAAGQGAEKSTVYLPKTPFDPEDEGSYYVVEIDAEGPVVYSECCLDRIGLSTARLLHEALGRWLTDQPGTTPQPGPATALTVCRTHAVQLPTCKYPNPAPTTTDRISR